MDKTTQKNEDKKRAADKAVQIILEDKMLQEIAAVGKGRAQKVPSDAIQRCFAGTDGKAVAGIVIARAKSDGEQGESLRAAFDKDGVDLYEWEEWLNNGD